MKKISIGCFFLPLIFLCSCSYNSFEEKEQGEVDCMSVSYSQDVSGIISTNCAISGCHAGAQSPDLRNFTSIQSNAERIKIRTGNRTMPKTGSLTQREIDLIACWVDNGAMDN